MQFEPLFGIHAVSTALKRDAERIQRILVMKGRHDSKMQRLIEAALDQGIEVEQAGKRDLEELVKGAVHQGIVALCKPIQTYNEKFLDQLLDNQQESPLLLILDGVTDPHNLGACLRTADAAGVQAVIAPKDKSAPLNATAAKVACGAAEAIPYVLVTNLARTLKSLQERGIWITGTAGETDLDIYSANLTGPMALVMGAEGQGMRRLTRENCDQLVKIPMAGEVSSLNVSVATGICLFEAVRQRS
ncbi:23S rRNA (guanosine(2251)-2'-O)-methyltransferase RlmB [Neptuniibacter halophilus]|uniref:23S rRNA (guanosine(2251)-2'-O)-methyltransferase RlmB n=1 Tax=Neptuniibacter halophilus TaxID=651666 RepID=UPI0025742EAB|nr:23S rRNA (guanosine(2251)-2'-O)-methyltransferase RlmB [Neptuniibacter halophilus]